MTCPFPPLTDDERAFVTAHLRLVPHFVKKWRIPPQDWEDATQDGMLGLMRAAQLYRPELGYTFSTYAAHQIRVNIDRGRGRREGASYRRAKRTDTDYRPPISLERVIRPDGEADLTYADVLASVDDTEATAVDDLRGAQVIAAVLSVCDDDLDRATIAHLAGTEQAKDVAERMGVSLFTVQRRALKIKSRLRHPTMRRQLGEAS
jgi:RNA polymerase sigma factor (sigma-70 family)